jgi:hypothetical protein
VAYIKFLEKKMKLQMFRKLAKQFIVKYPRFAWQVVYFWCEQNGILAGSLDDVGLRDTLILLMPKRALLDVPDTCEIDARLL